MGAVLMVVLRCFCPRHRRCWFEGLCENARGNSRALDEYLRLEGCFSLKVGLGQASQTSIQIQHRQSGIQEPNRLPIPLLDVSRIDGEICRMSMTRRLFFGRPWRGISFPRRVDRPSWDRVVIGRQQGGGMDTDQPPVVVQLRQNELKETERMTVQ